jgi:DNA-binding NarL/FixJ family response regulator
MTLQPERRPRVVIADDHPSVLVAFARMLQRCCDVVASVPNGQGAIDAADKLRPDILLVDLMLPDLDGLEVCRRVKQNAPDIDIIIVTAFDDPRVREVAMQDGASAFVAKHSAAASLEPTIQRIFAQRQREREQFY